MNIAAVNRVVSEAKSDEQYNLFNNRKQYFVLWKVLVF